MVKKYKKKPKKCSAVEFLTSPRGRCLLELPGGRQKTANSLEDGVFANSSRDDLRGGENKEALEGTVR